MDRYDYVKGQLDQDDLLNDPFSMLQQWLQEAHLAGVTEPNGMVLSTSLQGQPSSRVVLLRGISQAGLVFFTNYESRKGQELAANPNASVNFWWAQMERQVRVEGIVEKVAKEESDDYFSSRPKESQAASAISPQSQAISSKQQLIDAMQQELEKERIERPDHWGGYRLVPSRFEFWQGGAARLHDRFTYIKEGREWRQQRLAP